MVCFVWYVSDNARKKTASGTWGGTEGATIIFYCMRLAEWDGVHTRYVPSAAVPSRCGRRGNPSALFFYGTPPPRARTMDPQCARSVLVCVCKVRARVVYYAAEAVAAYDGATAFH